ncbi:ASCH domain-containing protein [Streptomyces sp. RY43-2]|uniref:ASCH domain-containing protein n=1 Tax=Streptomyces macrolidinus TaxID=2952607 RepID=A0ABT0ZAH2_9ACTN|nr:ASCH domain-containing protein [Streptomyces macrolidinus]MCN9240194.1 ASCH domain-containing protein [Streptomyces macrolidinus]
MIPAMRKPRPPSGKHVLNVRKPYFDLIATGTKTIEIRVGYPKIRHMAAGDSLRFVSGTDSLHTCITEIKEYGSFEEMLAAEDNVAIGEPGLSRGELLTVCRDIYPPEKEALGVFAIHVALLPR